MDATLLLDTRELLVVHEHPVHSTTLPAFSEFSVEERSVPVDQEKWPDFKVTPEGPSAVIGDVDHCVLATLATHARRLSTPSDPHQNRPGCTAHWHAGQHKTWSSAWQDALCCCTH